MPGVDNLSLRELSKARTADGPVDEGRPIICAQNCGRVPRGRGLGNGEGGESSDGCAKGAR